MKFEVDRDIFAPALAMAKGIAADGNKTHPIIGNVLLRSSGEDRLEIVATDLELSIWTNCSAKIISPGAVTLPAKLALDLVHGMYSSQLLIHAGEDHRVILQSGKSKRTIPSMPPEDFPLIQPYDGLQFAHLSRKMLLKQTIEKILYSVPKETDPFSVKAACLQKRDNGACRMYGSDGHRMAYCDLADFPLDLPADGILVPLKALTHLRRHLEASGEAHLAEQEGRIMLKTSLGVLSMQLLTDSAPDFESIVPHEPPGQATLDCDQLQLRLVSLAALAQSKTTPIRLSYEPDRLSLQIKGGEIGVGEDEMDVDYEGDTFTCHMNYHYLKDVCQSIGKSQMTMHWVDHMHPFLFLESGNKGCLHLIMPMVV